MDVRLRRLWPLGLVLFSGLVLAFPATAPAQDARQSAVIHNGTVKLGVWDVGHLNVPSEEGTVGLRYVPTGAESTSPGCLCEGWGVADRTTQVAGHANEDRGVVNLTPVSFTFTESEAKSVVDVGTTFRVTHHYRPSPFTPNLYRVDVMIENISSEAVDVIYRRVMDWDVEPTPFEEFVTIDTGNASELLFTSNDGFASSDPLTGPSNIGQTGSFTDVGPNDHGALFDFGFGLVPPGESTSFVTYYGAAGSEAEAVEALGAGGAEAYSFGQPSTPDGPTLGTPNTFIFAFGDVGGAPIFPPEPEPEPTQPTEGEPIPTITLTPQDATRTVGESHTVMAHTNGTGSVRFFVEGAHGFRGTTPVNAAGDALFSYPSSQIGGDRIVAYLDRDRNGVRDSVTEPITSATVQWHLPPEQQQPREEGLPGGIPVADSIDDLPNPQAYRTANVERLSGQVFVQLPSNANSSQARRAPRGFIPLRQAAQLPLGTIVDTSKGRVAVETTATNSSRNTQDAQFFGGRFQMIQRALNRRRSRPVSEMVLKGGSRRGCPGSRRVNSSGVGAEDSARRRSARSRVRRLWGRGRGRFRTRGRYSSATVRGTTWLVEDRCGGTLTRLPRRPANSRVEVRDFLQRRTIQLRAGRSYFARASSRK